MAKTKAKPGTKQRVDIRTLTQDFLELASSVVQKVSDQYHSGIEISQQDIDLLIYFGQFTLTSRKVQIERVKAGIDNKVPLLPSTQMKNANLANVIKLAKTEVVEADVEDEKPE